MSNQRDKTYAPNWQSQPGIEQNERTATARAKPPKFITLPDLDGIS